MQAVVKSDELGDDAYAAFTGFADVGDFYEFAGTAFTTKRRAIGACNVVRAIEQSACTTARKMARFV